MDTDGDVHLTDPIRVARSGPADLQLTETFPNPAPRRVTVRFAIPEAPQNRDAVALHLYDLLGRRVITVAPQVGLGRHQLQLSVDDLASGTYVLRLVAGEDAATRRLTVVR